MNKIKITVEQKRVLEGINKFKNPLETFNKYKHCSFEVLREFTLEQFALLLCGWYEVEQPFNVGEWVYDKGLEEYRKIENDNYIGGKYKSVSVRVVWNTPDDFEKVTETWKIMLLNLGREKPEFKIGDKYNCEIDGFERQYSIVGKQQFRVAKERFEKGSVVHFHAVEHRIEVKA